MSTRERELCTDGVVTMHSQLQDGVSSHVALHIHSSSLGVHDLPTDRVRGARRRQKNEANAHPCSTSTMPNAQRRASTLIDSSNTELTSSPPPTSPRDSDTPSPPSSPPDENQPSTEGPEHPNKRRIKVSLWRLGNVALILGIGTAKAVMVSQGSPAANALEIVIGMVWVILCVNLEPCGHRNSIDIGLGSAECTLPNPSMRIALILLSGCSKPIEGDT